MQIVKTCHVLLSAANLRLVSSFEALQTAARLISFSKFHTPESGFYSCFHILISDSGISEILSGHIILGIGIANMQQIVTIVKKICLLTEL